MHQLQLCPPLTRNCSSNRVIDSLASNKVPSVSTHLLAHSYLSSQKNPPRPTDSVGVCRDATVATFPPRPLSNPAMLLKHSPLIAQSLNSRIHPTIAGGLILSCFRAQQDARCGSDGRIGGRTRATASQVPQGAPAEGHRGPSDRPDPTGLPGVKWHSYCGAGSSVDSAWRKPGREHGRGTDATEYQLIAL